jgi:hypothetical protein
MRPGGGSAWLCLAASAPPTVSMRTENAGAPGSGLPSPVLVAGLAADAEKHHDAAVIDPLREQAAVVFAADLAAERVPSIRAIPATLHVGQPRPQRLRDYLASAVSTEGGSLVA